MVQGWQQRPPDLEWCLLHPWALQQKNLETPNFHISCCSVHLGTEEIGQSPPHALGGIKPTVIQQSVLSWFWVGPPVTRSVGVGPAISS